MKRKNITIQEANKIWINSLFDDERQKLVRKNQEKLQTLISKK